jgi:hypothetical protein
LETQNQDSIKATEDKLSPTAVAEDKDLEATEWQDRFRNLYQYKRQARIAHSDNRREMAIDEDFYDKIQLDAEDISVLTERRQPILVYNIIKNIINWILGTEKKARVDYRILPRNKADVPDARAKTKVFKYLEDVNLSPYHRSRAFEGCIKAGVGWLEEGVRNNGDEPIFMRSEEWRNMWFDHLGVSLDGSDWRYCFREKWIDLDILTKMWPEKESQLKTVAENVNSLYPFLPDDVSILDEASEFDFEFNIDRSLGLAGDWSRPRLKVTEMWYRMPAVIQILRQRDPDTPYGALDGAPFRKDQPDHQYLVRGKYFTIAETYRMVIRQAIWTGSVYLQDIMSPYNHWRFPFIPMFCYRRKRDNMPYGVIRDLRDPQIDLNQRKMRSLFLLTAHQIEYEKGTIDDPVKAQEEANRPDGMIELNEGALAANRFRRVDHITEAEAQLTLAKEDVEFSKDISGIMDESLGKQTNAISGKAVTARQLQSHTTSGVYFDNYYLAFQLEGETKNALIEQFMDQEKEVLVSGEKSKDDFLTINKKNGNGQIENCITRSKARFIVGKQDFRESLRIAMFETLSELVSNLSQTMPQEALALLDMVVEGMDDLPYKDELVARIRKINGQRSPEEEEMTDEEKAQAEKEEQALIEQKNLLSQIKIAAMKAQADRLEGEAVKFKVDASMKKIEGFIKALEAAGIVQNNPALAEAADSLIADAEKIPIEEPSDNQGRTLQQNAANSLQQQNIPSPRQLTQQPIQQTGGM